MHWQQRSPHQCPSWCSYASNILQIHVNVSALFTVYPAATHNYWYNRVMNTYPTQHFVVAETQTMLYVRAHIFRLNCMQWQGAAWHVEAYTASPEGLGLQDLGYSQQEKLEKNHGTQACLQVACVLLVQQIVLGLSCGYFSRQRLHDQLISTSSQATCT